MRSARLDGSCSECRCYVVETDVVPPTGEHKAPLDVCGGRTEGHKTRHSGLHDDTASTMRLYSQVVYSHRTKYHFFSFILALCTVLMEQSGRLLSADRGGSEQRFT